MPSTSTPKARPAAEVEVGRSLEAEALVGSILQLANLTDTPVPSIQAVYACVKLLNKVMLNRSRERGQD